jgi:aspartate racemase
MVTLETDVSARRAELSAEQQALLKKRLRGAPRTKAGTPAIPRRVPGGKAPLSFAQQRLWFLDQLKPCSPLYNLPTAVRLGGRLDREALSRAIQGIIARHESLRTCFIAEEGNPAQVVAPASAADLQVTDLTRCAAREREAELQRLLEAEARRDFDLTRGPLVRVLLIALGESDHVLLVNMHHIVSDAWSTGVFFRELAAHYEAFREGRLVALPELPIQYPDYAAWQREWMQGSVMEKQLAYWKRHLQGAPSLLELPADKPRPARQSFSGGRATRPLAQPLTDALKRLSQAEGATLFMTLLAAFKVLLHRYTRQANVVVGSPVACRHQLETEGLIGFFVNTLALHTDLSGNPTFRETLARVRQGTLEGMAHQDLPFERLVEELQPMRSSGYTPLVQVLFVFQTDAAQSLCLPGLTISALALDTGTSKFDLTLAVEDRAGGLRVAVEYSTDLFKESTIHRMLGCFQTLLEAIAANPSQRIGELPLLTEAERRQVVVTWNGTQTDYPRNKTIPELFEAQVEKTPDAVALVFGESQLTYRELNGRANQLAHHLQKHGVTPGTNVGLCLERSAELIVGLLGILKAGGAYVSLDPAYPRERLASMLADVQARVVLTQKKLQNVLPELDPSRQDGAARHALLVVCLDTGWGAIAREHPINPVGGASAESPAYVSFTSGSTGRPKGVCVPHRGVVRLVKDTDYVHFGPAEVFLQLAPVAFDASTLEIWGPLLNGGRLVIFPPRTPTLTELGGFIQRHHITTLWLTAGLFHQMIEEQLESLRGVRQLLAGGDVLSVPHVKNALERLRGCRLINGYGPTENTTFTCCHRITSVDAETRSIPIGRPIANTQVYILDDYQQPVPVGVPGELCIGGDGLALGYVNRPELTAEKFVRPPFSSGLGTRLYKTGDLVRWLPDGVIEFLGRSDTQVKIRGFRVELGEIEAVLSRHPGVRECVVAARADASGNKQLVARFVSDAPTAPTTGELREHLRRTLPDYMMPAVWMRLDSLPLNANGKVDRNALPAPDRPATDSAASFIAPRDAMEAQLARTWEEVLGLQPIGVTDHFFDLGGHSLLAVRLVARIEKTFGRKIPVATVFQSPTVAQLANVLRELPAEGVNSSLVAIQPRGARPPLFLIHGVGGGMFWGYTNLARHLGTDQPVHAFKSRGMDGLDEFGTIEEMAAHYAAELRAVQPDGPYCLGGYCFGGNVAFEVARQLQRQGARIALLALINCAPPNSSYHRIRITSTFCLKFLKNLGYWAGYLCQLKRDQQRDFLLWKLRAMKKKFLRLFKRSRGASTDFDVEDLVDLSAHSAERRKLWETHVRALMSHRPGPYAGHVTLFRTRGHSLLCSFDDAYGWQEFAAGGVTVKIVPGAHESILDEPYVQTLAEVMRQSLRDTQNQSPEDHTR